MKHLRAHLFAIAVAVTALPIAIAGAAGEAAQWFPVDLRVAGGEDSWHAENSFRLEWDRSPAAQQGVPGIAVGYRIRDAAGQVVVPEGRLPWEMTAIENIHVPSHPGTYTADLWFVGPRGERGPVQSAALRFDDVRPGTAQPLAPTRWLAANSPAILRIEHPAGPMPISGLRGYAVSVDRGGESSPCAGPDRCSAAETDLDRGSEDDTVSLGLLPEGANVVRTVAVSGSGMRSQEVASAIVRVDTTRPEVSLQGAPQHWASGPVQLRARATDALSGMAASGPSGPYTAIAIDGGVPRAEPGDSAAAVVTGEGPHRVAFYAHDAAGNSGEQSPGLATVRIDEGPPQVGFTRFQDPAEPERIEATVSDSLSGPDPQRGSIAIRPAGSRQRFETLPTATAGNRLLAHWDSDAFPPGSYEFRASAYDVAGNAASSDRRDNGARMVLANPLKTPAAIEAGFGGRHLVWQRCKAKDEHRRCRRQTIEAFAGRPATRVVPYGRGVAFAGRLTSTAGVALGSQPVEIVETFAAGADPSQRSTTVTTAPDGRFVAHLAPGPSRRVEAVFAGNRVLTRAGSPEVRLLVLGGVRLHASARSARIGGAPVVFAGRVADLGAPTPLTGRPVELQFRLPGGEWSEFRTVQTDAHGRFHYAYAFSDDDSRGIRFQFRAYVPAHEGWPYEPATSRPVFVTGS